MNHFHFPDELAYEPDPRRVVIPRDTPDRIAALLNNNSGYETIIQDGVVHARRTDEPESEPFPLLDLEVGQVDRFRIIESPPIEKETIMLSSSRRSGRAALLMAAALSVAAASGVTFPHSSHASRSFSTPRQRMKESSKEEIAAWNKAVEEKKAAKDLRRGRCIADRRTLLVVLPLPLPTQGLKYVYTCNPWLYQVRSSMALDITLHHPDTSNYETFTSPTHCCLCR